MPHTERLMMGDREQAEQIEKRLKDGESRLWCYNTCLIHKIDMINMARYGNIEIVKLLLESGKYNKEKNNTSVNNSFIHACGNGHIDIVKLLVENGAEIYSENDLGLKSAVNNGQTDIVKFLLEFDKWLHTTITRCLMSTFESYSSGEEIKDALIKYRDDHSRSSS